MLVPWGSPRPPRLLPAQLNERMLLTAKSRFSIFPFLSSDVHLTNWEPTREESYCRARWGCAELHLPCGHRHTHSCLALSGSPSPAELLDWGYWGRPEGLGSFLTTLKPAVANSGVLNAFLLANSEATSPLQVTFQSSQKKYIAKGYRHTLKPAEGTPPAPQGSR